MFTQEIHIEVFRELSVILLWVQNCVEREHDKAYVININIWEHTRILVLFLQLFSTYEII